MYIRPEMPEDYKEIYQLVKAAFGTAPVKDGDEQDYVVDLRKSSGYIPQLALVAVENEKEQNRKTLIGYIMLTQTELVCGEETFRELLLSPLCVAHPHRKNGVGGSLMRESFRLAADMGYTAVFLCGDPNYYERYGFRPAACYGIRNRGEGEQKYVMAYELTLNALDNKKGTISIL